MSDLRGRFEERRFIKLLLADGYIQFNEKRGSYEFINFVEKANNIGAVANLSYIKGQWDMFQELNK